MHKRFTVLERSALGASLVLISCWACSGSDTQSDGNNASGGVTSGGAKTVGGSTTSGGASSLGGAALIGGSLGTGGKAVQGGSKATGGAPTTGGVLGTGGMAATGGSTAIGGRASGGALPTGGASATGGSSAAGGAPATGGAPGTGGVALIGGNASIGGRASGGAVLTGGVPATGGSSTSRGGASTTGGTSTGGISATGGTAATTGGTGPTGGTGAGGCPHAQLKGSDICTIGDSWIQMPGNQVTTLENHMVAAGVIPSGDHFDRREVSGSTLSSIIGTYNNKPANCKILVMDGGGIDLFSTPAGDQAAIDPVVQKFKDFLTKLKTDGYVQHIIYSLYPVIPTTPNLNTNMKPGFSAACAASAVDCHLVDLEPLFQGQHFASDRTHADNAGGVIIGDAWWKAMQENCIAQ